MITPGRYDIGADRWVACIRTFVFRGVDFTDAVFVAQVRQVPDTGGAALVDLSTVGSISTQGITLLYGGTDTIANHITAGRLSEVPAGYESSDTLALSEVGMRINETTMEGLPFPGSGDTAERGDDVVLNWDMHITPDGGIKDKYLGGTFTVRAGVTQ